MGSEAFRALKLWGLPAFWARCKGVRASGFVVQALPLVLKSILRDHHPRYRDLDEIPCYFAGARSSLWMSTCSFALFIHTSCTSIVLWGFVPTVLK